MKIFSKKFTKILTLVLSAVLVSSCLGIITFADKEPSGDSKKVYDGGFLDPEHLVRVDENGEYVTVYSPEEVESIHKVIEEESLTGYKYLEAGSDDFSYEPIDSYKKEQYSVYMELETWKENYDRAVADAHMGDIDGDNAISAMDARKVLRASAKLETLNSEQTKRADVLGYGKVNASDARKTLRVSAKLDLIPYVVKIKMGEKFVFGPLLSAGGYLYTAKVSDEKNLKFVENSEEELSLISEVLKNIPTDRILIGPWGPYKFIFTPVKEGRYEIEIIHYRCFPAEKTPEERMDTSNSYSVILIVE